jgi:hypothetical protein
MGLTPPGYGNVARYAGWMGGRTTSDLGLTPPGYRNVARYAAWMGAGTSFGTWG